MKITCFSFSQLNATFLNSWKQNVRREGTSRVRCAANIRYPDWAQFHWKENPPTFSDSMQTTHLSIVLVRRLTIKFNYIRFCLHLLKGVARQWLERNIIMMRIRVLYGWHHPVVASSQEFPYDCMVAWQVTLLILWPRLAGWVVQGMCSCCCCHDYGGCFHSSASAPIRPAINNTRKWVCEWVLRLRNVVFIWWIASWTRSDVNCSM